MKNHFHLLVRIKPEVELKLFDSQNKILKIRAEEFMRYILLLASNLQN